MMTASIGLRVETVQGLDSLNGKKSYCTISRILDSARLVIFWNHRIASPEAFVKFQNDRTTLYSYLAASRFRAICCRDILLLSE